MLLPYWAVEFYSILIDSLLFTVPFLFQGNSNGIASVDVSAGFVGLNDYVEIPAIFLTALATYSGPLLWAIHLLCYLSSEVDR